MISTDRTTVLRTHGLIALAMVLALAATPSGASAPQMCSAHAESASAIDSGAACRGGAKSGVDGGKGRCLRCDGGCEMRGQNEAGRSRGRGDGLGQSRDHRTVMQTTRSLVHDYRQAIEREVIEIENGVITVTRSPSDPEAARVLERHVRDMQGLIENGGQIRGWDPLFREIFAHYDEIDMEIETIDGGVKVTETSHNPEVVKLIQAHARKVNEFVARGPEAVHEETPLPEGYTPQP